MSFKIHFASLSMSASVDQQTGNLSVFELVEEVRAPQLPFQIPTLVIALSVERTAPEPIQGRMFIHIVTPDGNQAMVGSGDFEMPNDQSRMKAVFRFGGFPIQAWGKHRFVLSWLNPQGVKQAEALLDFNASQVESEARPQNSGEKPPLSH